MMKNNRMGKKHVEIIKDIGLEVLDLSSLLPGYGKKVYVSQNKYKENYLYKQRINRLKNKGFIYLSRDKVKLTKKGLNYLKILDLDKIKIKSEKWDGIWRVVSYDIPDKCKKERDYFRNKLLELGFKKLQESMFVIPYKCKEEIAALAQCLSLSPYVIYLKTDKIPNQSKYIRRFGL